MREHCRDAWRFACNAHQPFWLTCIYIFIYSIINGLFPPHGFLGLMVRVVIYALVVTFSISRWTLTHDRPDYGARKRDRG